MKWIVTKKDIQQYKEKYGGANAVAGYADGVSVFIAPASGFFILVVDDEAITIVQLTFKLEEKEVKRIPLSSISSVRVRGLVTKGVRIQTNEEEISLSIRQFMLNLKKEQKELLDRLSRL